MKPEIEKFITNNAVTMRVQFVPFSQSRNKGEKSPSLNWIVTLAKNGRDFLTTNYMAGSGYCPGGKLTDAGNRSQFTLKTLRHHAVAWECENGFQAKEAMYATHEKPMVKASSVPILPDICDVLYSLSMDASVLDYGTFESWASECDYDVDSRKAESIYRACLEIALKMRGAFGDAGLQALQEVCQDY